MRKRKETVVRRMRNEYNKSKKNFIRYTFVISICVWTDCLCCPKIHILKF